MKTHSFAYSPIALALTLAVGSPAMAQEDAIEEIVVKGSYVKSLEKAVEIKRDMVGFSDSIVATDIADLPEQNLVEALQRMPGVTIEREKGLGTKVNVRSLPNEFTFVAINNLATASGSGGRDVDLSIFASEIIQTVTVKKSPTAADEEGGIAGAVQISTARPFDYDGRKIVGNIEAGYDSLSEETQPRFSLLASDTFGDWGALVSFSSSERTNRTDSNSGVDFRPLNRWLDKSGSPSKEAQSDQAAAVLERDTGITFNDRYDHSETDKVVFMNKVGDRVYVNEQDKWGATVSLQYKPSNTFNLSLDGMWGSYDAHENEYDAAAYAASSNSTLETIHEYDDTTLADYGVVVLTDVSYAYTQHEFLSKENVNNTDFTQLGLTFDWQVANWDINGVVGYSGATRDSEFTNLKHVMYGPSRTRYTEKGGETILSDNPDSVDMYNNAQNYIFESYEVIAESVEDDKYAAQLDFSKNLSWDLVPALANVQFGVRYTDKSKQRNRGSEQVQGPGEGDSSWSGTRTMADSQLVAIDDLVPGGKYSIRDITWSMISNNYARENFLYAGFNVPFNESEFYQVDEKVTSLYGMADFEFEIGNIPVQLNAGLRYIDTEVLSSGYHQIQNSDGSSGYTAAPISKKGNYTKTLPSLNLTADITDNLLFRAAASETFMRPALDQIAYKRTVDWNGFKFNDGNPDLKPVEAEQWEAGLEYYLEEGGIFAVSYFFKNIAGVVRESLTGTEENVTKLNADGSVDGIYDFEIYQNVNAEGSYDVSGWEFVAQFPLNMLHDTLDGFGINANYTLLDNTLTGESDLDIPTPPVGLADSTYNLTAYYENDLFDVRVSYNYKDEYVQAIERDMYPVYRDAYGQYDLSIGYQLTSNIKVRLNGINMTNEKTQSYTISNVFPQGYSDSGRRISLSIRGDF
ncbi:MAG: hypothetical protein AXW14_10860 [Alteromonas sp. Nap_26]|nr:MAG: hypothetical protein AXW14_10860 [Alteromonas sp. Nap_26]